MCHTFRSSAAAAVLSRPCPEVVHKIMCDAGIEQNCKLDAIITVVDAKHLIQHLDEEKPEGAENEAVEQLVFADKVLLNKIDLVDEAYVAEVERRILELNKGVSITRCTNAEVPIETVLNIGAFSLEEVMKMEPEFLADECGHYSCIMSQSALTPPRVSL